MAVKRFSTSFISESGQDKSSNFIANYSPAIDEMDLIERVVVGSGGTSAIEFTLIPATYQHLQVRFLVKRNNTRDDLVVRLNADTGSNYADHALYGNGSSANALAGTSRTYVRVPNVVSASTATSVFGAGVIDILDYANTSKNTVVRYLAGVDQNGSGDVSIGSGLWLNTNAITGVTLAINSLVEHSTAALYGVKA